MELRVRNVQEAYVRGLALLREQGQWQNTRNGRALVHPEPVMTVYERPQERVLLDPARNANPFFHLMESLWMLAGRSDVASLLPFNKQLAQYSDDGLDYHGAYGRRWRNWFVSYDSSAFEPYKVDQLQRIIDLLTANPDDRRIVLQMWDAESDLGREGKDFPCNTQVYFRVREDRSFDVGDANPRHLDMTVCCRSNDAIWGAYGANAVHFSILQEFVAAACGFLVGRMYQLSNNLHAYEAQLEKVGVPGYPVRAGGVGQIGMLEYKAGEVSPLPIFGPGVTLADVDTTWQFVQDYWNAAEGEGAPWVPGPAVDVNLVAPVVAAYWHHKRRSRDQALAAAGSISHPDWRRACVEWLERAYVR